MNRKLLLLPVCFLFLSAAAQKADFNVVPLPREITSQPGATPFVIDRNTAIVEGQTAGEQRNARFLQQYILERIGWQLPIVRNAKGRASIAVRTLAADKEAAREGYRLEVDAKQICIEGNDDAGAFYGIQTLRKALPHLSDGQKGTTPVTVPATRVSDAPRFGSRGISSRPTA